MDAFCFEYIYSLAVKEIFASKGTLNYLGS